MRQIALILSAIFLALTTSAYAADVQIGATKQTPPRMWLEIRNKQPIGMRADMMMNYGEPCMTESGGEMTVIGAEPERILVLYRHATARVSILWCPDTALGFVSKDSWDSAEELVQKAVEKAAQLETDRDLVQKLLEQYQRR